jgi:hypothetical protein
MDTIGSAVTVIVVLAIIFVPQLLLVYFAGEHENESARDEYVPDGR